ncbi:MAG: hypothetical protein CMM49_06955 [Rhodospirillaceae bacterium]|nr:hypothetical protein [Rhodospirillaceae bacterium]|tara:strand:+ start:11347 stop:12090 length:744 start_codon:yes stop_codon:yes gene_type:complete
MKKLPKITIRFLPIVAFLAAVSLCVKLTNENFTFKPIGIAIAQDEDGTSKDTEKSDLKESGEATLQEALDEDSESLDGPKKPIFTAAELDILENLSERRKSLDARSSELDIRENLLVATQKSVEEKINELKKIEVTIRNLLGQHDKQEKKKLLSLVRVYESMKPKDAARIFEELDLNVVVDVAELMEERRLAPVLASMDPLKAKTITIEIRTRRKLPESINVKQKVQNQITEENQSIEKEEEALPSS